MKYWELKRPDIEQMQKDEKVVVVPLGSIEQHGAHLPIMTDSLIGGEIGERIEAALPDTVLLLPMQWLGASHHHLQFPGAISVPSSVYIDMVYHLCDCLLTAGFRRIYLLLSHGGNDVPCREALNRLALDRRDRYDYWLASGGYWAVAEEALRRPEMETARLTHACEYETAMVQHLRPELVDMDQAQGHCLEVESRYFHPNGDGPNKVHVAIPFEHLTGVGALGRPELGTPEKGRILLQAVAEQMVDFVQDFSRWKRGGSPADFPFAPAPDSGGAR
ncbi:creatininase family protein [Lignipirellula cremea]|uniref:Creatinine amidohydrolase n=1 Tax=Lignipirellula cremea TaxID=2528010 RepID=A0A518DTV7_9BACT|nr:creatininase family protein [Lignipirellula cremea]QDU95272.1 Creatinine amidohydrolase [Lignipirellula cremea]